LAEVSVVRVDHIDMPNKPIGGRLKADTVRQALIRDSFQPRAKKVPGRPKGKIEFEDGHLHCIGHSFTSSRANQ